MFDIMVLSIAQIIWYQVIELLVNYELKGMWKEAVGTNLKYSSGICLEMEKG
jgi:hypothetical protein